MIYKSIVMTILLLALSTGSENLFSQVMVGELAHEFEYTDTNGETHKLSDYKGKVVFLVFIGYGCPFCRAEAPSTESDIWQLFKNDSFQAIALETWNGSLSQARAYVKSSGITYPLLTHAGNELDNFGITYDNYLVIDHQGVLRYSSAANGGLGERYRVNEIVDIIKELLTRTDLNTGKIPDEFNLSQNFPNPFNSVTLINYSLLRRGHVSLFVYDILGRRIDTLVDEEQSPSEYEVEWSPFNSSSRFNLSSGIYFYQLKFDGIEITRKMVFVK